MAQLDANIFLQQQGVDFDKVGQGFERGMRLGDMMRENKIKQAEMQKQADIKDAYKAATTIDPMTGEAKVDPIKLSSLVAGKGYTQDALKMKQDLDAQQAAQLKTGLENNYNQNAFVTSLLGTVKDQASYDAAKMLAKSKGIPGVDQLPSSYNPQIIDGLRNQYGKASMTYDKQLLDERQREEARARLAELGIRRQERLDAIDAKNASGEKLPLDSKKLVEALTTKNASKISIANQINSDLETAKTQTPTQKLEIYRGMVKTLNSKEGQDAVGVEEAKRLASKLEFAMGNLFNDNPTQFGRDLEGFETQAQNVSDSIQSAVLANQKIIDEKMGRSAGEVKIKKEDMPQAPKEGALKKWEGKTYLHTKGRWVEQ